MTQPPRRRRLSNVAKFWIGVLACLPALVVAGFLVALPSTVGNELDLPGGLIALASLGMSVGLLAVFVFGLARESTRFFAVGMLAGAAILFVLAAGACVVLLAGLGQSP
ncbi:hypothetical protein SAMN04489867_2227 [Pedococcus dokdonensis]|uniref:Uncharacterized protein n=1 Tax=Pedococcus dokdonensis TaxID=443156 RepID=A0A1H0S7W3_9MICO|nr:hypothetical protein [Pedococcus dokdonensis]SDP37316.1 hypothetical protein SAMN04489867_2227 [Pedococcus dokdonensis]